MQQLYLSFLNTLLNGGVVTISNENYNEDMIKAVKSTFKNLSYEKLEVEGDYSFVDEENHFYNKSKDVTVFEVSNAEQFFHENMEGRGVQCILKIPTIRETFKEGSVVLTPDFFESYM